MIASVYGTESSSVSLNNILGSHDVGQRFLGKERVLLHGRIYKIEGMAVMYQMNLSLHLISYNAAIPSI